ncbi:MAG: hypothetical protein AAB775_02250 [Patescibacteria group bacterium]
MLLNGLPNPLITESILFDIYREMGDEEYEKALNDILTRGAKFIAMNDSEFSNSLSENDAVLYAVTCKPFLDAFKELQKNTRFKSISSMHLLAKTIAWWQCVSTFRILHDKPVSA